MSSRRPKKPDADDLAGFLEELRPEARKSLHRHGISNDRAMRLLAECWVVAARSEGNRAAKRRQFLEALEIACQQTRADLGPPEEEGDDESIH